MKKILITGANRGIGLEFTVNYLNADELVIATCRDPEKSKKLQELKIQYGAKLELIQMDVANENSISEAFSNVQNEIDSLDILINNAGTNSEKEKGLLTVEMDTMSQVFSVNTFGPVIVSKYFSQLLSKGDNPIIVNIFSGLGFITNRNFEASNQYSYSASKAALNMCVKYIAADLEAIGISVIGLGPGFVLTDLTKGSLIVPPLTPKESVENMVKVIKTKTIKETGNFYEYDGRQVNITVNY